MSKDVVWTKLILETFIAEAELSEEDEQIHNRFAESNDNTYNLIFKTGYIFLILI